MQWNHQGMELEFQPEMAWDHFHLFEDTAAAGTDWHADTAAGGNADWYGVCAISAVGYDFFSGGRISEGNDFPAAVQTILSGR